MSSEDAARALFGASRTPITDHDQLVYDAEELAHFEMFEVEQVLDYDDADFLDPDEVADFIKAALIGAGYGPDPGTPTVVFDIPDDSEFSGIYRRDHDTLHFHPRTTGPFTVLHELAHWCRSNEPQGHGPQFCGIHVSLVRAVLGEAAAAILLRCYREHGVDVDRHLADPGRRAAPPAPVCNPFANDLEHDPGREAARSRDRA